MPERLTERESETLGVVIALTKRAGFPPTMREVAEKMGVSGTLIAMRFRSLQFKGYMSRRSGESRAIKILYDTDGVPFTY